METETHCIYKLFLHSKVLLSKEIFTVEELRHF